MKELSRRSFLKGGLAAAAGTAGIMGLAGCSQEADSLAGTGVASSAVPAQWDATLPEAWDYDCEILILGSGIAGSCAAVEAHDLGADVLVVNAAKEIVDCSCTLSGGWFAGVGARLQKEAGVEDSVELFVKDIMKDGGEAGDPELIRAWAELSGETIDWLEDEVGVDVTQQCFDARLTAGSDSHSVARDYTSNPPGNGIGWMQGLQDAIAERGINLLAETKATKVYRDETGRAIGARLESMDGSQVSYAHASKAVLLTMGGLGRNLEAHKLYTPAMKPIIDETPEMLFGCSEVCLGLGYDIAKDVNARLFNSPKTGGMSTKINQAGNSGGILHYVWGTEAGFIDVGKDGKRFYDETNFQVFYNERPWQDIPEVTTFLICDDNTRTSEKGQIYLQATIDEAKENGVDSIQSADTLEELAELCGIDPTELAKSVESFNSYHGTEGPDEFGRTSFALKIEQPPFWAARCQPNLGISKGGCKINVKGQVIDNNEEVIPGLYAAGEMAFFQLHGDARTHIVGGPNSSGACYGRICARNAVEETPVKA